MRRYVAAFLLLVLGFVIGLGAEGDARRRRPTSVRPIAANLDFGPDPVVIARAGSITIDALCEQNVAAGSDERASLQLSATETIYVSVNENIVTLPPNTPTVFMQVQDDVPRFAGPNYQGLWISTVAGDYLAFEQDSAASA